MNKVILMGRLTRDPETRYAQGENATAISRYTLAVDRRYGNRNGEKQSDYISCVAFGKNGEFADKYLRKGLKICVCGRIQTGNYTKSDGTKVYTTDVVVEEHDFCESKGNSNDSNQAQAPSHFSTDKDGFMEIPDSLLDGDELPFA